MRTDMRWQGEHFQFGEKTQPRVELSRDAMMRKKDKEREEIAQLTAQFLIKKDITVIPYGVRTDIPKIDFKL